MNWRLASDQSLGIVLSRGYRGGGGGIDALTGQPYTYDPETADNLELSYRWESTDRRWRVAANAFHMRWRNQQINVPQIPGDFTSDKVVNAGRSTVQGGELEIQARPSRSCDVFASLGMADTRFDEFRFTQAGAVLDLTGNPFPQAPKWNGAFGAQWRLGGWFAGGDVKHTGRALSRSLLEGVPADLMPDYTVLNLRGGFQWDAWRLSVQMANVTDERYFLYRFDTPAFQVATVGRPRTVSVVLDGRF
jgi:outer membrane receptor protein involved in Fe transport